MATETKTTEQAAKPKKTRAKKEKAEQPVSTEVQQPVAANIETPDSPKSLEEKVKAIEEVLNRLADTVTTNQAWCEHNLEQYKQYRTYITNCFDARILKDNELSKQIHYLQEKFGDMHLEQYETKKNIDEKLGRVNSRIQNLEHPKATMIEIKPLDKSKSLITPTPSKDGSIGDDLMTVEDIWIRHGRNIVPTNICINLPRGIEAKIEPRSGFSAKGIWARGIQKVARKILGFLNIGYTEVTVEGSMDADVINGKIDPGYRDGLGIIIKNNGLPFCIPAQTRLAQITYYKTVNHRYKHVEEFSDDAPYVVDRKGGFGSSDK